MSAPGEIESRLASFAHAPPGDAAPRDVMALSLLDWAACGIAGADEPVARITADRARGAGPATLLAGGQAGAAGAALANGAASHALDYDDTHFDQIGHTSVAVVPAALALAEREGRSMGDLLDAALVGSEAAVRVGVWLGRTHYQTGFHQTATSGAFGASVAAARLLGLDEARTVTALGLTASLAGGLKSQFGTMAKPLQAGLAARAGVEAADWAAAGMTASEAGLSDPQGFGATHHGEGDARAFDELGRDWRIARVSHKFHACCHGLHATLEALEGAGEGEIAEVEVATHPRWLRVCALPAPRTGLEAKFSYAHAVAMRLSGRDTAAPGSFSDACAADAGLVALRERVRVAADETLPETAARVRLRYADGGEVALAHDLAAPRPLDERRARVRAKARALLGDRADDLAEAIARHDLAQFVEALGRR